MRLQIKGGIMSEFVFVVAPDWISRCRDGGVAPIIEDLSRYGKNIMDFLNLPEGDPGLPEGDPWPGGLNLRSGLPAISEDMYLKLHADLYAVGDITAVVPGANIPDPVSRLPAATAIGFSGGRDAAWASADNSSSVKIQWYVEGILGVTKVRSEDVLDLSIVIGSGAGELDAQVGDVIQAAFVDADGVVGWWVRATV